MKSTGNFQLREEIMDLIRKALLFGLTPLLMHASVITGNLLTNPGAEDGNLTGWTAGGDTGAGVDNGSFDPGINPYEGSYDFYGGVGNGNSLGTLSQTDSIVTGSVSTALIDTGTLSADVSFWVQSLNQGIPSDEAYVQLTFLNGSNSVIGTVDTPPFYSIGVWTNYNNDYAIPVGTRSIEYTMEFQLEKGINIDSFVDDNILEISGSPMTATPEPSMLGGVFLGIASLCAVHVRRKQKTAVSVATSNPL
jgi:hypothetical protein